MSRSASRETTNFKLAAIIQGKEVDDDELTALKHHERAARTRLHRASLYNGGARTILPKVKKKSNVDAKSPFVLAGHQDNKNESTKMLTVSSPPGAHDDQYRVVRNLTRINSCDPDRVCVNSSSMVEGLKVLPQPPWYVGYNNQTVPPDASYILSANRYGYRGSLAIQQFNVEPYEIPAKTTTIYTPKFLASNNEYVDEYVPPILATKQQSINNLETPKLWPENTAYVNGYAKKELPSSWFYKRETTVDQPCRPQSPTSLTNLIDKVSEEKRVLQDFAIMEKKKSLLTNASLAKKKLEETWRSYLLKEASSTLKQSLNKVRTPYDANTLSDPSDTMRYSGSTALIVHSQTIEELKFRLRMDKSKAQVNTPFEMKWQHIIAHFNNIKHKLKRNQSMTEVIDKIAKYWHQSALKAGSETALHRAEFVQACGRISYFEDVSGKQMSQLYSLFDPNRKNNMRFVEILLMMLVLDKPEESIFAKLRTLWSYATQYGLDRSLFDIAFEVLCCFASSRHDLLSIESYFKSEFRPRSLEYAITGKVEKVQWTEDLMPGKSKALTEAASLEKSVESQESNLKQVSSFSKHQYNICEGHFSAEAIVEIVQSCPALLKDLDAQLSSRLLACYGRDDRYKEPDEPSTSSENLDFSWIMKREAPKREIFSLY